MIVKAISHTTNNEHKNMKVLKLPDMIIVELCKFAHKFNNDQLPNIHRKLFTTGSITMVIIREIRMYHNH